MIETLFKKPNKAKEHLLLPLLQERELFPDIMKQKGRCLRSLQMAADYLLFAVQSLELNDDSNGIIKLEDIAASGELWKDKKPKFYVSTVVKWLDCIRILDPRYHDDNTIFNSYEKRRIIKRRIFQTIQKRERVRELSFPVAQTRYRANA